MMSLGAVAIQEAGTAQFPLLEQQIRQLAANKWLSVPLAERIAILEEMRLICWQPGFLQEWVMNTCRAKGLDPQDPAMAPIVAEEWLTPALLCYSLTDRIRVLKASKLENGSLVLPSLPVTERNGRKFVKVFPHPLNSGLEPVAFQGFSVELVLQDGKPTTQATSFKQQKGRVCLVLGAGNVDCGGAMDAVHKLYTENQVCVIKYNPVNEHCAFFSDKLLQPLIKRGFVFTTKGGMAESSFLTSHPLIDTMHLTGSDKTYQAIVWGPGPQQTENMKVGRRLNSKPFSCELGAVSPYIIAPGTEPWPESALRHHAKALATATAMNGGFICASPKALILPASWPQRGRFMELLEESFKAAGGHPPYYPGADVRQAQFMQKYGSNCKVVVSDWNAPKALPHVIIRNVPANEGEYALKNEAWSQVLAEVPLDVPLDHFLPAAVEVANNKSIIWGTLSSTIIAGPSVPKDQVEAALVNIRYGAVGLNIWGGMNVLFPTGLWGGFPGARPEDIQSGVDVVSNVYGYDYPEKAILRTPFISPNHPGAQKPSPLVSQRLLWFLTYPSIATFSKVLSAATVGL